MFKTFKNSVVALMITASFASHAGLGLSYKAVMNMAKGDFLVAPLAAGAAATAITYGLDAYYGGSFGISAFLLVLEENEVIEASDRMALENADKATQDAYMEILFSDLSETEKAEALSNL